MAENAQWYVVQTYSGYENTVKATIEKTIENRQLQDVICEAAIPMETVTEVTENGPKTYERKLFPGYVLVKMVMNSDTWYIVRNIRGVTGFVGARAPIPLPSARRRPSNGAWSATRLWSTTRWATRSASRTAL